LMQLERHRSFQINPVEKLFDQLQDAYVLDIAWGPPHFGNSSFSPIFNYSFHSPRVLARLLLCFILLTSYKSSYTRDYRKYPGEYMHSMWEYRSQDVLKAFLWVPSPYVWPIQKWCCDLKKS
jgi:hypothetical protein